MQTGRTLSRASEYLKLLGSRLAVFCGRLSAAYYILAGKKHGLNPAAAPYDPARESADTFDICDGESSGQDLEEVDEMYLPDWLCCYAQVLSLESMYFCPSQTASKVYLEMMSRQIPWNFLFLEKVRV